MLRPVIFIGCGGSGTKAVRYVRDAVARRLAHAGWTDPMPEGWQFIGVDTLTVQENPTEIPTIPSEDFLGMSVVASRYSTVYDVLEMRHRPDGSVGNAGLLHGWLPDKNGPAVPLKDGAGQNRAIGRAAGLLSMNDILTRRLENAFAAARSGGPGLRTASEMLGVVDDAAGGSTPETLVAVCSSMAGGTGAGVVLDVLNLVRRIHPDGGFPALVLFTNDIFTFADKSLPMAANSLALMCELLAAYWSEPGEIQVPLPAKAVLDPGIGPHSTFLLGRRSFSGSDLGDTTRVYRAAGEALATWVVSPHVQERVYNFISVNWRNNAKDNHGGYPFGRDRQFGAVSSFGAAKVTVGRDRFARWAEHLLARRVLDSLHTGHMLGMPSAVGGSSPASSASSTSSSAETASGGSVTPPTATGTAVGSSTEGAIRRLGAKFAEPVHSGRHHRSTGLHGCREIRDAFDSRSALRAVRDKALTDMRIPAEQQTSGQQWSDLLRRRGQRGARAWEQDARQRDDSEWIDEMVRATCLAVSEAVALSSLPAAIEALRSIEADLNPRLESGLREQSEQAERDYRSTASEALESLAPVAKSTLRGDSPAVQQAASGVAKSLAYHWRSFRLRAAAELVRQATSQVYGAIRLALESAHGEVAEALEDDAVKSWPSDTRGVPEAYMPSSLEFPIESVDTWTGLLRGLCNDAALRNIPYGPRSTDPPRFRMIAGHGSIPALVDIRGAQPWAPGSPVAARCRAQRDDIMRRVEMWTKDPAGAFRSSVSEGLRSHLSPDDPLTGRPRPEAPARLGKYKEMLRKAKQAAAPLIQINSHIASVTMSKRPDDFLTVCSEFPFAAGHPANDVSREIIGDDTAYQSTSRDTSSVLVSSYVKHPMHPLAVQSFITPVANALHQCGDPAERSSAFWLWRRAHPLSAFVPLPRALLKDMICGYAVARLCGYIANDSYITADGRISEDPKQPVMIATHSGAAAFPHPLLTRPRHTNDLLGALLESFAVTFADVVDGVERAYAAYKRLQELGEPVMGGALPRELRSLLESGRTRIGPLSGQQPRASGATQHDRRETAKAYVSAAIGYFDSRLPDRWQRIVTKSKDGVAPQGCLTVELASVYIDCHRQLLNLLEADEIATVVL